MFEPPVLDQEESAPIKARVVELFPAADAQEKILALAILALHFQTRNGTDHSVATWQRSLLSHVGRTYFELFAVHCLLERESDCTPQAMQDGVMQVLASLPDAEAQLQLLSVATLPPGTSPKNGLRDCHLSFVGALALALPYRQIRAFFNRHYYRRQATGLLGVSFKTVLQEFSQKRGYGLPQYKLLREFGPKHASQFEVEASVGSGAAQTGSGPSKKSAEERAAEQLLRATGWNFRPDQSPKAPRHEAQANDKHFDFGGSRPLALIRVDFGIPESQVRWLRRALTHGSFRGAHSLPHHEDNRAIAVFGSRLLQASFARYLATKHLSEPSLADASPALLASGAISTEALAPLVEQLGLLDCLRLGPAQKRDLLAPDQGIAVLQGIVAARFLGQVPNFDVDAALVPAISQRFEMVLSRRTEPDRLKSARSLLQELLVLNRTSLSVESVATGPAHRQEHLCSITLESNTGAAVTIRGGKGRNAKQAREDLCRVLVPLVRNVHQDFAAAQQLNSPALVGKIASTLLPDAFSFAPETLREARKWHAFGLLGSALISGGDDAGFKKWAAEAWRYLETSTAPVEECMARTIRFYQLVCGARAWNLSTVTNSVFASAKAFAASPSALEVITGVHTEAFFLSMQQLLRVLNLAAKPMADPASLRQVLEDITLLRRREYALVFEGPDDDLHVEGREGALLELCSDAIDRLALSSPHAHVTVQTRNDPGAGTTNLIFQCPLDQSRGKGSDQIDSSLLTRFLQAEGLVDEVTAEPGRVCLSLFPRREATFPQRALAAVRSAFGPINMETRTALSKLLHDLKNQLIAAQVAASVVPLDRTLVLKAKAAASEHLDMACLLADQFGSLAGVLAEPVIAEMSVPAFFRRLYLRWHATFPVGVSLGTPANETEACVWTAPDLLEAVLENLVRNALEAMRGSGRVECDWTFDTHTSTLLLSVRDNGPGMPAHLLQALLAGQAVPTSKKGGSGVGMLTVTSMLRRIGARINGSSSRAGTEWLVEVPSLPPISSLESESVLNSRFLGLEDE